MARSPTKSQLPKDRQADPEEYNDFNTPNGDVETGEYLEVGEDPDAIILEDAPDGGLLAPSLDDEKKLPGPTNSEGFYANLAEGYCPRPARQNRKRQGIPETPGRSLRGRHPAHRFRRGCTRRR